MNPVVTRAPTAWAQPATQLNKENIERLLGGDIPAIHLPGFATADECRDFCAALQHTPVDSGSDATTSPMRLIGSNFSNHRGTGKADYFATVDAAYRDLQHLSAQSFDPLARILQQLGAIWPAPVAIAEEPGYGRYFAGGIKTRVDGSALHFDYVPRFVPDYRIGEIIDQFSWNLYLAVPKHTGETTLFNAPVRPDRAADLRSGWHNLIDPDEVDVDDAERYTFRPRVGEVVLFNTRNPHTIVVENPAADEQRIQIGSFIGRLASNELILWS